MDVQTKPSRKEKKKKWRPITRNWKERSCLASGGRGRVEPQIEFGQLWQQRERVNARLHHTGPFEPITQPVQLQHTQRRRKGRDGSSGIDAKQQPLKVLQRLQCHHTQKRMLAEAQVQHAQLRWEHHDLRRADVYIRQLHTQCAHLSGSDGQSAQLLALQFLCTFGGSKSLNVSREERFQHARHVVTLEARQCGWHARHIRSMHTAVPVLVGPNDGQQVEKGAESKDAMQRMRVQTTMRREWECGWDWRSGRH